MAHTLRLYFERSWEVPLISPFDNVSCLSAQAHTAKHRHEHAIGFYDYLESFIHSFRGSVSCSPGWPKVTLQPKMTLNSNPPPASLPKYWPYKFEPPFSVSVSLITEDSAKSFKHAFLPTILHLWPLSDGKSERACVPSPAAGHIFSFP